MPESALVTVLGGLGLVVCLLLAITLRQALLARDRAREAEAARNTLEQEMAERERVTLALHRSEGLYRTLASNLPDVAVCLFDTDMRYLLVEGPLLSALGLGTEGLEGGLASEILPARMAAVLLPLHAGALAGEGRYVELPFKRDWFSVQVEPVRNESGEIYAGMTLVQKITERKRAENELRDAARRLANSNRELQDFAYIASHDLQEPLRKVQAFGDRLKSRHGPALGEQGNDYLDRMQGAAGRMRDLLEGLLDFSRVTTNARPFEGCDLGKVAAQVLGDLEIRIEESGAVVELGPLPTLWADPLQMRQLLQNLLSNALKFHEPGKAPHVRLEGTLEGGEGGTVWAIRVSDDGIGFDEKYGEKIFAVFQRLHGRGVYEGSGVGLAICRKIVERHGGEIGATSAPGRGATFIVRLPAEQAGGEAADAAA